ncbi:probable cytochrome P450 313a4 [Lutzomyia longipalpis]|uniref:probable cytochrome P450 313a4 n=1 Tax=Lutzomyia longipalpis TaxID=7200 RepID=UPI00248341E1|nr:probable cytochrome P450 313a4 [Lutzomyia longipalpis]
MAPQWNVHRKLLNSMFSLKILQSYLPIFNKESKILVSRLEDLCNRKDPIDICMYTKTMTYDAIYHTTLNKELSTQQNQNFDLLESSNKVAAICGKRVFNPFLRWDFIYRLTSTYREEKKYEKIIREPTIKAIEERKLIWKENFEKSQEIQSTNSENEEDFRKPQIFVDQLMKLLMIEKKFTQEDVIGEASAVIGGGYETTGNALAYCILMLAMFPENQDKMYEEIKSVVFDEDVHCEDLNKCHFIERFIKEVLRLFPSAPLIGRKAADTIKLGKYIIPEGTNFLIPIILVHRSREIWGSTAENFDPDRFLPENMENIHPYAFLPFAGGPRHCIGIKYTYMIIKTALIHIVRNFKFRTDLKLEDLDFEWDITLHLLNKHMVYVEKRNH